MESGVCLRPERAHRRNHRAAKPKHDRDLATYNRLFGTNIEPVSSSLYFFAKIGNVEEILAKAHVALVPGSAFGMDGYARFAFTETEEEIVKGLEALHLFEKNSLLR